LGRRTVRPRPLRLTSLGGALVGAQVETGIIRQAARAAGRDICIPAARDRVARVRRAGVAVVAGDRRVHAARRRVAGVRRAGVAVVARTVVGRVNASENRIAAIDGARHAVVHLAIAVRQVRGKGSRSHGDLVVFHRTALVADRHLIGRGRRLLG